MRSIHLKLCGELYNGAQKRFLLLSSSTHLWPSSVAFPRRCFHSGFLLQNNRGGSRVQTGGTQISTAGCSRAKSAIKKKTISPEEQLVRRVNTLVGQRDAVEAVRVFKSALRGELSELLADPKLLESASDRTASSPAPPAASTRNVVFSSKALAAALYACDATGNAADGLSLVAEVRQRAHLLSADWLQSEHVLFAVLRLQCAAGDRDGATHMFAYLEQHGLLRLRSASVFLRYCCTQLADRRLAFAVYEKALQHKVELTEPDYVALGVLCVQVKEPVSTLFFMLEEMKEHVSEVSAGFIDDVVRPWLAQANAAALTTPANTAKASHSPRHYHMEVVERIDHVASGATTQINSDRKLPSKKEQPSTANGSPCADEKNTTDTAACHSRIDVSTQQITHRRGVCPACHTELSGYPFTAACRDHLLRELRELVIPQACRTPRARQGFEHWRRYLHTRHDRGDRVDVFVDGANLGYYGLSSWYDLAKRELMLHRGVPEAQITPADLDFTAQCKSSRAGVDVGVNFDLIDQAVSLAVKTYGLTRPLVMLHERHVEPRFMTPQSSAIVQRWRARGWLYCSPKGLNDDLCWLYGALLMTEPTDVVAATRNSTDSDPRGPATASHRTFVCTNDKMRDHHFRLLSPRAFTRWRDRHRIGFRCARVADRTELYWELPAPYERCIQRHDTTLSSVQDPVLMDLMKQGLTENMSQSATTLSTWHIPFAQQSPVAEKRSFLSKPNESKHAAVPELPGMGTQNQQINEDAAVDDELSAKACIESDESAGWETLEEDALRSSSWACIKVVSQS